jgi:hypothetical protein
MTKRDNASMTFTALFDTQWEAIRSIRDDWLVGPDWRREIERIGRAYWEAQTAREKWVEKLQGKKPAEQRKKIYKACVSIRQLRKTLAALADDGLLDNDFPHPDLKSPEQRLEAWLSDYDLWVRPFAGQNNPIQSELEWRLMDLWKRSGGKLRWSRKKDDAGTPYAPLIDFLTLTLNAILGKALKPSGVVKLIDRNRGGGRKDTPYLMYAMRVHLYVGEITDFPYQS